MAICRKHHRYLEEFNELPEAQDNKYGGRHICAACAYKESVNDALFFCLQITDSLFVNVLISL